MASIARVTSLITGITGTPGYSNQFFSISGASATLAEANDVTGRVRALWAAMVSWLAVGVLVNVEAQVTSLDVPTGALTGIITATTPTVVTSTGTDALPLMTQAGLKLVTSTVSFRRLVQGRAFLGPLRVNATTVGGQPSTSLKTSVVTAGTALLSGATGAAPVVWVRPDVSHSGGATAVVTSVAAADKFWSLRSRRD